MAGAGDNVVNSTELRSFVERLERLAEEGEALKDDVKEVKVEAKSKGYDIKTLERLMRLRKQEKRQREVEQEMLEAYMAAMGML